MVLSREKRLTAGKAPSRLEQGTPPPPTQLKASKKPVIGSQKVSRVSRASQAFKKAAVPAKRLILALKTQGTQPADLRREENILTASATLEPLSSDLEVKEEEEETQEEQEKELSLQDEDEEADTVINDRTSLQKGLKIVYETYNVKWSVILGAKSLYHTHIMSNNLDFDRQVEDACCRASTAAEKLKKKAERRIIKASVKIGSKKPLLWTLKSAFNLAITKDQIKKLQEPYIGLSPPYMRVAIIATFDLIKPVKEGENIGPLTAHKRALSQVNSAAPIKK